MAQRPAALTAATAYTPAERRFVLLFAIVGALIESMELNLLSYPLGDLAASFRVTNAAVVATITAQSLASIAGGFLFGWIADRWGRRPTYVAFTATYSVLAIAGALVTSFDIFVITRVLAGLAMGGAFGVIFAMFSESWKSPKRGFMGSVLQGMFIAGTLLTQLILFITISSLGSNSGWRWGFLVIGAMCLLIAAGAAFRLPESKLWRAARDAKKRGEGGEEDTPRAAKPPLETGAGPRRIVLGAVFLTVCTTGVFAASYSYITFAPTFLRQNLGVSLSVSTIVLTVGTLLGIASYLVFGILSDRIGRRMATLWSCVLGVLGFGAFALFGGGSPTVATVALMGAAIGYAGFGVLGTWISEFYPTRFRAFGSGATYYVARGLGSGLFPLFALSLAGGNLRWALALGGFGAILGLLGCIFVPDTANKIITAQE
ncbi:SHS family lactate transporter-like MFS transporter [Sinomonas atrocyanea]|uniref:MFS transporter n=1 Tax=Sinomonas atrocyanea TaxID=37927 RepID=UPI00277F9AE3|nr:MFS transporter [Sinomonas atrocyanea]MDP9884216.1 SHS family lactate transporter-like MFS transporter [Sinomonas atrocyanea]